MSETGDEGEGVIMRDVGLFLGDADEFLLRAEEALGGSGSLGSSGSPRSPEKGQIRNTASKMVSNMVNKIRRGRGVDMHDECEHLLRRQKDAEARITEIMEHAVSSQEILLEQGVTVFQRLQSCRAHNEAIRSTKKPQFEDLMNFVADVSSTKSDLQAIVNYLSEVRRLEEDEEMRSMNFMMRNIYDNIDGLGNNEKKEKDKQAEKDKARGISEEAILERLASVSHIRDSMASFFAQEIEAIALIENTLGSLKDTERRMKEVLEGVVPDGAVDAFFEAKLTESSRRPYDHNLCNDCETAASMCQEFIDLVHNNHKEATEATTLLQRCLMVSAQLIMVKEPLAERATTSGSSSGGGGGDGDEIGVPIPLLRSLSGGSLGDRDRQER